MNPYGFVLEFSEDPLSDTTPTWTDVTADLRSFTFQEGRDDELGEPRAGSATFRLRNTNRRFEPQYAAGEFYPNIVPLRRFRLSAAPEETIQGIEFWGDFEFGADGTAPEWTTPNGFLECKAGAETRQLTFVTSPTPRLGARIARFEVASGDQFGATSGERCEVRRGTPNGGFGTGNLEGETVYTQFSTRFLAPWSLTGEGIFQQTHDSGSTYGAPFFRWRMGSSANIEFRVVTGRYPNSTDAGNGVNAGTSFTHTGLAFATDTWFDFRHVIYYTTADDGWYIAEMKLASSSEWTRVAQVTGVATLPSYPGSGATSQFDKLGFYRGTPQASTNVVFQDGYQVGHSWSDVGYPTSTPGATWNQIGWRPRPQLTEIQVGNPDFEADITGTAAAGGGTTTRTWDTTRAKFGNGALKMVTNGAASGQGAFHTKRSLSRFDVTGGATYTASCWYSGDGFENVRIGIEFFDSGASSLGTTFSVGRGLRTDWRHHYVTVTAPGGAVTARIRTSLTGTAAATFWVDGVGLWEGTYGANFDLGLWYAQSWELEYPDPKANYSEVVVECVDGFGILSLDTLAAMDPPEAESYEEVVEYDQPWGYWRGGEPSGTKVVSHSRKKKRHGKTIRRRWRTVETRAEAEGVAGPSGTYKKNPTLGVPGLILGDTDTAVSFTAANSQYARFPLDDSDLIDGNNLTLEAWVKLTSTGTQQTFISGPFSSAGIGAASFWLGYDGANFEISILLNGGGFVVAESDGTLTINAGTVYHVVGRWNGSSALLYVDGIAQGAGSGTVSGTLATPAANPYLLIGARTTAGGDSSRDRYADAVIDEVAVYEKSLEPATVLRHYQAGAQRGFAQQVTGPRISAVVTSDLWSEAGIGPGKFQVVPRFEHGQAKVDEIAETLRAELPRNHFYFDGFGNPVYKGWNYDDGAGVLETFGDTAGETGYTNLALPFDDEIFNEVTTSTEEGPAQVSSDATSQGEFRRRAVAETGLLLVNDTDAMAISADILEKFKDPQMRLEQVSLNGATPARRAAIFGLQIGDKIRFKRRQGGGTAIDIVTTILGRQVSADYGGNLQATFMTARGFDASLGYWRLGVAGFSELGSTTVLA